MQFQFRSQNGDFVVIEPRFQAVDPREPESGTELVAATITDSKLSEFSHDDFFAIMGDFADYFSRSQGTAAPAGDWYADEFLPGTVAHEKKVSRLKGNT